MGIHGVFKEINPASQRISLAKYSAAHLIARSRPLILAIDTAIWLFQIQSGKGGSNPALRTFYYRLLRLLSLNIQPIFVFDGPNKPTWKRNKKVGGPGVRVASVPEFLAKQLLKQFGFPIHVAPGEAEAECAVLQRAGIVDAVMSEDVDTLMFGSGILLRNWSPEGASAKTPTHVTVYRADETKDQTGMDGEGMILVALMSGGDYIVEGIPGCGPKVACDAARAGFGKELCALAAKKDHVGLSVWRERLQHEIRTNTSKFFSRKNSTLQIPSDFPNMEVLGYYTHPCVSSEEKLARLKLTIQWDQAIDFPALRSFAAEAFDWRCRGGAKKFIRNLAPAMLVREIRRRNERKDHVNIDEQQRQEAALVAAIHGKRTHATTDGELEYRVSFTPASLVPIDLSIEEEDDEYNPNGGESDGEGDNNGTRAGGDDADEPASPSKKRALKPYDPDEPEKLWIMKTFLQLGCPLLIEDYEAALSAPKGAAKSKGKARATGKGAPKKSKGRSNDMPANAIMAYTKVSKPGISRSTSANDIVIAKASTVAADDIFGAPAQSQPVTTPIESIDLSETTPKPHLTAFRRPMIDLPSATQSQLPPARRAGSRAVASSSVTRSNKNVTEPESTAADQNRRLDVQRTPQHRKRALVASPSPAPSQRTIDSYWSPSPKKMTTTQSQPQTVIDLLSSSPPASPSRAGRTPRASSRRSSDPTQQQNSASFTVNCLTDLSPNVMPPLPESVTRRRQYKRPRKAVGSTMVRSGHGVLERAYTAPVLGCDGDSDSGNDLEETALPTVLDTFIEAGLATPVAVSRSGAGIEIEAIDLATPAIVARAPSLAGSSPGETLPCPLSFLLAPSKKNVDNHMDSNSITERLQDNNSQERPTKDIEKPKKKRIVLRESLPGAFKEVDIDCVDLSGDGSGWQASGRRAHVASLASASALSFTSAAAGRAGWRKSGVEVLDLTGA